MTVTPDEPILLKWIFPGDDEPDGDAAPPPRDEPVVGTVEAGVPQLRIHEVDNTLARRFPDWAGEVLASAADIGFAEGRRRTRAVSVMVIPA